MSDIASIEEAKARFKQWAASLEPAGMVDEESGLTTYDVAMLEVSLIIPPLMKNRR